MQARTSNFTQVVSAAKAGISERSGRTLEKDGLLPSGRVRKAWKTRQDPFQGVWEEIVVPLLKGSPHLSAITLLEHLQDRYPGGYSERLLRTLQRRLRQWRAVHGCDQEIMFRQIHTPGRQGLSDFTSLKGVEITIHGKPFSHLLYHFRLAYSKWSWMKAVRGGESFTALSSGLQDALWDLGGCPLEHRTDSLSAAFKNLTRDDCRDITRSYKEVCRHYGMTATRNNPGKGHENGSVESPHGHLKRRLEQALILRGSYDFESIPAYQQFIDAVVQRHNRRHQVQIDVERQHLRDLPLHRTIDFSRTTCRVTTSSTIFVQKVMYSVPSRLIGHCLTVHIYDDRLSCYLGGDLVLTLPRVIYDATKKATRCINYRHLIASLSRKPQAFRYSVLRDELLPTPTYKEIWQHIDRLCSSRHACKLMVGILKLAATYECEQALGEVVLASLISGHIPCLGTLSKPYHKVADLIAPPVKVNEQPLIAYNQLLTSFAQGVHYA